MGAVFGARVGAARRLASHQGFADVGGGDGEDGGEEEEEGEEEGGEGFGIHFLVGLCAGLWVEVFWLIVLLVGRV